MGLLYLYLYPYLYLDWGPDVYFSGQRAAKFWKNFYRYIFHFLTKCYGDELK